MSVSVHNTRVAVDYDTTGAGRSASKGRSKNWDMRFRTSLSKITHDVTRSQPMPKDSQPDNKKARREKSKRAGASYP
jgi:hypothetical protein